MPYHEPEPDDPLALTGVAFETTPELARDAAYAFAEEFARAGWGRAEIKVLFASPAYQGPHSAFQVLGPGEIQQIIDECCTELEACRAALRSRKQPTT